MEMRGSPDGGRENGVGVPLDPIFPWAGDRKCRNVQFSKHSSTPALIVECVGPDQSVVWANQALADLLGYERAAAATTALDDALHAGDCVWVGSEPTDAGSLHTSATAMQRMTRRDGTAVWVRLHHSVAPLHNHRYITTVLEDWAIERQASLWRRRN